MHRNFNKREKKYHSTMYSCSSGPAVDNAYTWEEKSHSRSLPWHREEETMCLAIWLVWNLFVQFRDQQNWKKKQTPLVSRTVCSSQENTRGTRIQNRFESSSWGFLFGGSVLMSEVSYPARNQNANTWDVGTEGFQTLTPQQESP